MAFVTWGIPECKWSERNGRCAWGCFEGGHIELVSLLLIERRWSDTRNFLGKTALQRAKEAGTREIVPAA